jgi:hypothetical protein
LVADVTAAKNSTEHEGAMRIFIFKSETRAGLCAFAGDQSGNTLPKSHGPWTATGVVAANSAPPHRISRAAIEKAIEEQGFQLWRLAKKADAPV